MALKKIKLNVLKINENLRLDQLLAQRMPEALGQPCSKAKIRKLIIAGAVYLNGKRVRIASKSVYSNSVIDVYVDLDRLNSDSVSKQAPFLFTEDLILYEDKDLLIVNKPAGLPTQPTIDEARQNLYHSIKKYLSERESVATGSAYLGLHHRLDRDTSGVILFTKTQEINKDVAHLFQSHLIQKVYQALCSVSDVPGENWRIRNYLGRSKSSKGKMARFCSVRSGGDLAITDFKLIEKRGRGLWMEASPLTGRTHQIRVHLSEIRMPIYGDALYNGLTRIGEYQIPRLMLHAFQLKFEHPLTKSVIQVSAPLPEDFKNCLEHI